MIIPGGRVTLTCTVSAINSDVVLSTAWLLNGTAIEALHVDISLGGQTLVITTVPATFNRSEIQCVVQLGSGTELTSGSFLLQVQGMC